MSLEDLLCSVNERSIPKNTIVVTFDDGYNDVYKNAFPTLKNYSIPATIFLATEPIEKQKVLWQDKIFSSFRCTIKKNLCLPWKKSRNLRLISKEDRINAQAQVLYYLRLLNAKERDY